MPNIDVIFKQLAGSLIARSERGRVILIVKDDTDTDITTLKFIEATEVDNYKNSFTAENINFIKDALMFGANEVIVSRMGAGVEDGINLNQALKNILPIAKTGWVTLVSEDVSDYSSLVSWIKAKSKDKCTYKAVVYKTPDCDEKRIVNFFNDTVTFADSRGEKEGQNYLPSIAGILAACNIKRGSTYFNCSNLTKVEEVGNKDDFLSQGKFILFNDEGIVKIALGINSLVTTDGINFTDDMKFIDIVEAMDLIQDDISKVFKDTYLGKFNNSYNNQMLLVSSILNYFRSLETEGVLDENYKNSCEIDIDAIRQAWLGVGKTEAESWSDDYTKTQSFKRNVFLKADLKIIGTMENFTFNVALF